MKAPEKCNRCRFWVPDEESGNFDDEPCAFGRCRRFPPKVSDHMASFAIGAPGFGQQYDPEDMATSIAVYRASLLPATFCNDWCGEYQPAREEGEAA